MSNKSINEMNDKELFEEINNGFEFALTHAFASNEVHCMRSKVGPIHIFNVFMHEAFKTKFIEKRLQKLKKLNLLGMKIHQMKFVCLSIF